ncbi:MAG: 16S rRNA (uracil(1498)-N(3))-methyltransferase [Phycisphaerales bacterium]|nr:16S rRNA (uracil(1498)-N(3))-methyltransferase [Phycisphaerales bacterium]
MLLHRISLDAPPPPPGSRLALDGEEAWHAVAVKRVCAGDRVELLDGRGGVSVATVTQTDKRKGRAVVTLAVEAFERRPPHSPWVEVWSAMPRPDRAAQMIDQLAQVGAAAWRPLIAERSVTDAQAKGERLARVAGEASKQCGRAWHLHVRPALTVAEAAAWSAAHAGAALLADAEGLSVREAAENGVPERVVLVGPEGGFTEAETGVLRAGGARPLRLGPHVLRTETAAVAGAVALLAR